jgi:uncharacterized damage-inducible protein DinB
MKETPQEYIHRMLKHVEGKDPLKTQAATPAKLSRLTRNVSPVMLRKQPAPGKWSAVEILAHLADTEVAIGYRLRLILGAPGSPIPAFDQEAWATAMNYSRSDPKQSIGNFRAFREANLALLKRIRPEQWQHSGVHSERGEESVEHIVRLIAGHDLNHIAQIEAILKPAKRHT